MLLRIRWELIAADTNEAFALLLRYPEPATPAYTLIKDALYLRDHLTPQGGAEIVTRYGKPTPAIEPEALRLPRDISPSPSLSPSRNRNSLGSPRSFVSQQGGIEALLQGAAKNVIERGSQWGVGKALRDAVGEVRKNVEAYQSATNSGQTTPRSGGREFRKPAQFGAVTNNARPAIERTNSFNAIKRMEDMDKRNKSLAKMLEVAVGDLWEYHRERNEERETKQDGQQDTKAMESLSLAIAKVQFVQVYLEDSSIPLPVEEATEQAATAKAVATLAPPSPHRPNPPERTSSAPPNSISTGSPSASPVPLTTEKYSSSTARPTSPPVRILPPQLSANLSPRSRPHLTSSNFSWMLGEDSASTNFATGAAHSTFSSDEKRRMKGKGFLFGDDDDDESSVKEGKRGSVSGKGAKSTKGKYASDTEVEEEVIDLDNMGKRGVI